MARETGREFMSFGRLWQNYCAVKEDRDALNDGLAEIHRLTGRGDGHRSIKDTVACIISSIVTRGIDHGDELAELRAAITAERDARERAERERDEVSEAFENEREERGMYQARVMDLEAERDTLRKELDEAQKRITEAQRENVWFRERLTNAEAKLSAYQLTVTMHGLHELMLPRDADKPVRMPTPETLTAILDRNITLRERVAVLTAECIAGREIRARADFLRDVSGMSLPEWLQYGAAAVAAYRDATQATDAAGAVEGQSSGGSNGL